MYPLNLSGFPDFQWLQLLSDRGMHLAGTAWSWRGTPQPQGCPDAMPPFPSCNARPCSQQLPAKGLSEAQSETRAAWNSFSMENVDLCGWARSMGI